ncbi:MAG: hypothetical protein QXJ17_00040 [Nitrososphaeria archaeon]
MILLILLISTLIILGLLLSWYLILKRRLSKVEITLNEVIIEELKYKEGKFNIKLIAKNKNYKIVFLEKIKYTFYVNNYELGRGRILCNLPILPNETVELNALMQVKNSSAAGQIWASCKWRAPVWWAVNGTAYFKSAFCVMRLPFHSKQG